MGMRLVKKSEWFAFPKPYGEPNEKWKQDEEYFIERLVKENGEVVWFGMDTNWVRTPDKVWTVLTVNKSIESNEDGIYPEERLIFVPCKMPIYEKMYQEL